jgi:uroporphyrinogen-III synthase
MAMPATVLVVRPREQARRWVEALRALGVPARSLPLIEIGPAPDAHRVTDAFREMVEATARSGPPPVVVFVSPSAVGGFFEALKGAAAGPPGRDGHAVAWPSGARACAAGPGTAAALGEAGVPAALTTAPSADAPQIDSETLWQEIGAWDWMGRPVWIARGNGGREWLAERLRAAGARVEVVQAYERRPPRLEDDEQATLAEAIAQRERWVWMFSSSEAIANLLALAPGVPWNDARALASHPRIAERARAAGFGRVETVAPTVEAAATAMRRASS